MVTSSDGGTINNSGKSELILLKENTEVAHTGNTKTYASAVTGKTQSQSQYDTFNIPHNEDLEEYNNLVKLYHDMPKDLFVQHLLRMYASSESDLERVRVQYFEVLKQEHDDFPFGLSAELKRRVFSGNGDPISIKLAQDIYTIISVSQGEDYSLLKERISTSRRRSVSVAALDDYPTTPDRSNLKNTDKTSVQNKCQCSTELALLKDTVSSLQAQVLLLSQSLHASDQLRAGQMNFVKETMNNIKCDILEGKQSVRRSVLETEIAVSKKQSEIIKCEVDLQNRVNKLEKFIDTNSLYSVAPLASQNIPQAQLYYDENINTLANIW